MFVKLLLVVISFKCSQGFILECEFGNEEWINLGIVFQCKVQGMHVTSRNSITEVVGAAFRPLRDVRALDIQDQRCQFVPSDVQTFFPNVEGLQVANSELKELQNADMQQFPNLKQLFMSENELQSLENDVFEPCPNIEYINLGHNNIMHMGTDIFAPLKNLQYCNIADNGCIDTKMESPNAIQQFSKDVEKQCPPTPEMLKREKERKIPESLRTMAPVTTSTVAPEIDDLKEELKKLKNKIAEHDQQIDEIKSKENTTLPPEMPLPNIDNVPQLNSQDQPTTPEQNIQAPFTNPMNSSPDLNRPQLSSSNFSPPGYNLMDVVNMPLPGYQQFPSYQNQPQNTPPQPPQYPQYPQNTAPQMPPIQCGPYGCLPPNNQPFSPIENLPQQLGASNPVPPSGQHPLPPSGQHPLPHPNNFMLNRPQSPYAPGMENKLPFPGLRNPPKSPNAIDPEPKTPNSGNPTPQMSNSQNPQISSPTNPQYPQEFQPGINTPSSPDSPNNRPETIPPYPEFIPENPKKPQTFYPIMSNTNQCGLYSCSNQHAPPPSNEPSFGENPLDSQPPPMPYRNLDIESGLSGTLYYVKK